MSKDQVWKEEGLTIASLALRVGIPENHLRRLINDCLGYRNFPSYVNAHRIAAAKSRLADPGESRVSISTIAYDIGFASLGPFNRAFKEESGVSPSEWLEPLRTLFQCHTSARLPSVATCSPRPWVEPGLSASGFGPRRTVLPPATGRACQHHRKFVFVKLVLVVVEVVGVQQLPSLPRS